MRQAVSGQTFSPEYWKTYHFALIDLQRQLGFPTMFVTLSPLEWSTPYHVWIKDEMEKTFRTKMWLPAAETFHLAHVLSQAIIGLITGTGRRTHSRHSARWTQHVLAGSGSDGKPVQRVVTQFARLEFQDGKRKRGRQNARMHYHGSGRPHIHCLIWLENAKTVDLPSKVSAIIPDAEEEPELHDIVMASQASEGPLGSGWARRDEPSEWDGRTLRLHHRATDKKRGVRAYMPDVISGMRSHMDVQFSDGRGMLLRYVASYTAKFSDSWSSQWLSDEASDYAISRRVLNEYHPLEPEMFLQLGAQQHAQAITHGTVKRFVVPSPWTGTMPDVVARYASCAWRPDRMTLLEYMRRTNAKGGVHRKLAIRYEQLQKDSDPSVEGVSLERWALEAPMRGEVMIAARCSSRLSDAYYGQWIILNVPFRDVDGDLWLPQASKVPMGYRMFALALLHDPSFWRSESRLRAEMELEAHKDAHIDNVVALVRAHVSLVDDYIEDRLVLGIDAEPPRHFHTKFGHIHTLETEQFQVVSMATLEIECTSRFDL